MTAFPLSLLISNFNYMVGYFRERKQVWRANAGFDNSLLIGAGLCLLCACLLLLVNGLQTAFMPLNHFGQWLLPAEVWQNITFLGDTMMALTVACLFSYRFPQITLAILVSAIICTLLTHGFKVFLSTSRPPAVFDETMLQVIGPVYKRNSMPSGHTATAFVLAAVLSRCVQTTVKKYLIIAVAIMVAWSRIACGVHWPADVFAGAAVGLVSGWLGLKISDRLKLHVNTYFMVCSVLLFSAVSLFDYDGGFEHTASTAAMLGFTAVFYWLFTWLLALNLKPRTEIDSAL